MSIYKNVMQKILNACKEYKDKKLMLENLEGIVCIGAHEIVSIEEKELRGFLFNKEWELEKIRFTCEGNKMFDETLKIVKQIEERILKEISVDDYKQIVNSFSEES